jgi:lysophospholipase L1-like esterase
MRFRVLLAVCCLAGCRAAGHRELAADDRALRYTGWFDRGASGTTRFAWPGSQVELAFEGASVSVQLTDLPTEDETRETDWLSVSIDGGPVRALGLAEGTHTYELAKGLKPGPHQVLMWKRTEPEVGAVTLHKLVLDGPNGVATLAVAPRKRRLVFIGDSITAGYGNEGQDASCRGSAAAENNYETYGAYASRELAADYRAAAWSGKGVTKNFDARDTRPLPQVWSRVMPAEETSPDFGPGVADAVIVNLGTNDFGPDAPSKALFVAGYRAFLVDVRAHFPGAHIVLALGPMLIDEPGRAMARTLARNWFGEMQADMVAHEAVSISSIELWTDPAEGAGCDSHPNKRTHARMGRELAGHLRAQLSW